MNNGFAELGSVAQFINGAAFKPEDWCEEGIRIIRIQNLTDPSKPFNRTKRQVDKRVQVQPGDLLVSWSASLGVFEWTDREMALLNRHIFRVVPDQTRVDKRYLRYGLEGALRDMQRHLHGATMQHVNRGEFLATKLYLPSLSEQRRIAEILDKSHALRAKRRVALGQLDSLTQSVFLDLFGEPAANTKRFPTLKLADAVAVRGGFAFKSGDYTLKGIPLVRIGEVNRGVVSPDSVCFLPVSYEVTLSRFIARPGDLLMSLTGTTGKDDYANVMILDSTFDRYFVNQRVALLEPKITTVDPLYLFHVLRNPEMKKRLTSKSRGIRQANISNGDVLELELPIPPIELQREFSHRDTAVGQLKAVQSASLAAIEALFASLQHRAFRGEL